MRTTGFGPAQLAFSFSFSGMWKADAGKILEKPAMLLQISLPVAGSSREISSTGSHTMSSLVFIPLTFLILPFSAKAVISVP
uniref:Uncharacterized protein n=1 Tax=Triticum urartu TaxID=4572 RepID=A0A8R7U749_TRIUA